MLNYIWFGLVLLAVVLGGCTDRLDQVAEQCFKNAQFAVMNIALPLAGIMALWLGVMRLAERAGLVALLGRALRPLMRRLFADVPPAHPAMGSMLLNIAASALGLANAATPLGLRAMRDLESLNPRPGTATNAMCTFLAINTASVQLIPATAIAVLAANHSTNPTAIVGTSIMATSCGAVAAVLAAKLLQRLPVYRLSPVVDPPAPPRGAEAVQTGDSKVESAPVEELPAPAPLSRWSVVALCLFGLFFLYLFVRLAFPAALMSVDRVILSPLHASFALGPVSLGSEAARTVFVRVVDAVSKLSIPFLLSVFPLYAMLRRVKVYEEFVQGAKEGFGVSIQILPYLVAILVAIGMFRAAGGIELMSELLRPAMAAVGFPPELLPMVLMRPLSGSGTLGVFAELVKQCGPDSLVSRMGGTIFGSTETTFYVLAVYFGVVGIKKTRHALWAGLTADFVAIVASVVICKAVFA